MKLISQLKSGREYAYFYTEQARGLTSPARKLVESGATFISAIKDELRPKVLLLAIMLGGDTLQAYVTAVKDLDEKKRALYA